MTSSKRRDYTVTRLAGCFGPDMAEYCLLHILANERKYSQQRELQGRREWVGARAQVPGLGGSTSDYRRLSTLTLGVLGLGDIGSDIAGAASHALKMDVIGCRRDAAPRDIDAKSGVTRVYPLGELQAFLSQCDYIVCVLPSTPATKGLLSSSVLSACERRRPVMINVGRGDLISEESILESLDRGWLRHYVGDVFETEPLPATSPLWTHSMVTVTPHNSAISSTGDVVTAFADNLERFSTGGTAALRHIFDWESSY